LSYEKYVSPGLCSQEKRSNTLEAKNAHEPPPQEDHERKKISAGKTKDE